MAAGIFKFADIVEQSGARQGCLFAQRHVQELGEAGAKLGHEDAM